MGDGTVTEFSGLAELSVHAQQNREIRILHLTLS